MKRNFFWFMLVLVPLVLVLRAARSTEMPLLSPKFPSPVTSLVESSVEGAELHPIFINTPDGPPRLRTDLSSATGGEVSIACSTCHSVRTPNIQNASTSDLDEFHQGLAVAHGSLACLSCHNQGDYDTLKLASGQSVGYSEVMTLCAQCHGPQYRDYLHGAHGGMSGYWDLTRGPRTRNNCVDCHDAHAPAYPRMSPSFKPRDRFLNNANANSEHSDD